MKGAWITLGIIVSVMVAGCGPYVDPRNIHDLADQPAGILGGANRVGQRFTPECDGLSAIDLQIAIYPAVPRSEGQLLATISRDAATGEDRVLARARIDERGLQANQWVRLALPPVLDSRGATFVVALTSSDPSPSAVTVWATSHWSDPRNQRLSDSAVLPGSLTFRAFCDEAPAAVAASTWQLVARAGALWPLAVLLLVVPGLAMAIWLEPAEPDLAARLGASIGWSVLLAPLALYLATPVHLGEWLGPALLSGGLFALVLFRISRSRDQFDRRAIPAGRAAPMARTATLIGPPVVGATPAPAAAVGAAREPPVPPRRSSGGAGPVPTGDPSTGAPNHAGAGPGVAALAARLAHPGNAARTATIQVGVRARRYWEPRLRPERPRLKLRLPEWPLFRGANVQQVVSPEGPAPPLERRGGTGGSRAAPTAAAGAGVAPTGVLHGVTMLTPPAIVAILATIAAFGVRLVVAKDLVVPAWGDPVQHSYVAQLILHDGAVPADYGALVPHQVFDYHFGFQTLAAAAAGLSGSSAPAPVLAVGQILDALIALAMYRFARDITGSAWAGAVAAVLVGLVTTQPTYYVSWGRYPELAGLVALPAAYATVRRATEGTWRERSVSAAILACAAMIFVHPRTATFLAVLLVVDCVVSFPLTGRDTLRRLGRLMAIGLSALLLSGPWIARLWMAHHDLVVGTALTGPASLDFPIELALAGNDRWVVALALIGAAIGLLRRRRFVLVLAGWSVALLVLANPWLVHVPLYVALNGGSLAIAAFVPASVLVGYLASSVADLGRRVRTVLGASWAIAFGLLGLGLTQAPGLTTLVNPTCLLLRPGDLAAMSWVRQNTPSGARFLIDEYLWNPNVYMGSDAGYWLPVLAGRETTLPPLFYAVGSRSEVQSVNATAQELVRDASDPAAVEDLAQRAGTRYVFVGTRGGALDPGVLVGSGRFKVAFATEGAWVLEVGNGSGVTGNVTVTGSTPSASVPPRSSNAAGLRSTTSG